VLRRLAGVGITPASWLKAAFYAAAILVVYRPALAHLFFYDCAREDYSHAYLIPFIVLYLVWERREVLSGKPSVPSWVGLIALALGLGLYWLGELGGEFYTLYVSFWLVVVAVLWSHLGWEKIKTLRFALIMILTMFPFPDFVYVRLTFRLKLLSSQLGVLMLHLCGMSAYREGNIIDLGHTRLQVADACSGLGYVMPLVVLSLLLANGFKAHIWKRLLLFASSVPLAIIVNSFRIALTGVLAGIFGPMVAEGFFHGFSGWLVFLLCIPFLLVEKWILGKLPPKGRPQGTTDNEEINAAPGIQHQASPFFQPVFIVTIMLLLSTLALGRTMEFREKIPIKRSLSGFPVKVGEWSGSRVRIPQRFIDESRFSDYAMVDYEDHDGRAINFYTAYYESQRKGEAAHGPETCLPAHGWLFREAGTTSVHLGSGGDLPVNRAYIEKAGGKEISYYWFSMRGRILTHLYQVKLYTFWDALMRQRTDGALVRLITPVYDGERPQEAEARLRGFTREITPILKEFIPE
jgi:exosortase D (VPLPA-CTERM-specific)